MNRQPLAVSVRRVMPVPSNNWAQESGFAPDRVAQAADLVLSVLTCMVSLGARVAFAVVCVVVPAIWRGLARFACWFRTHPNRRSGPVLVWKGANHGNS